MTNMRQLIVIGALVVVSGLGAAVSANRAINGVISDMDENTAQTTPNEAQNVIVIPSDSYVTTEHTPDSVLQSQLQSAETPGAPELPVDNPSQPEASPIQPAQPVTPPERHYESHTSEITFGQ